MTLREPHSGTTSGQEIRLPTVSNINSALVMSAGTIYYWLAGEQWAVRVAPCP
jgi:hypothetical protein